MEVHGFLCSCGSHGDLRGVLRGGVLVLSVLLVLLELRDGVHLRPGLHLAHLGRVVALHHQHVGHLAVFLLGKGGLVVSAPRLQLELYPLPPRRRAHLLSINVARRYGDHRRLAYEAGQEGADPERGPVDPGTSSGSILRAAQSRMISRWTMFHRR